VSAPDARAEESATIEAQLAAARQGSTAALGRALEGCRQYLLVVARDALPAGLRAKVGPSDLVQETVLKAQQEFGRFEGDTEAQWLAWLRAILLNNVANCTRQFATDMRQVAREVALDAPDSREAPADGVAAPGPSPSEECLARERDEALDRALDRLPEHYRQVVLLHNRDHLSFEAVGQQIGQSAEAARKVWTRAVCRLRQLLEGSHGSE
jgi:RNA polymerase sigma-70 factor (ECF subfamily)